ncbi:MAG: MgtC/SapB family protein, partial [Longimicrobiales bacterium]|nr:MgtC/SapB family protein [Longimicrobiales bacterium]
MPEFLTAMDLSALRLDLLGRLLLAATLGGLVGIEREWSGKPAGFRTNLLICVGAALLTELSVAAAIDSDPSLTTADPTRIAAQIVSGIGFLGAGTIIQSRGSVLGLTTAATLWVVAAVGMAVGLRKYPEAVGTTVLIMVALLILGRLEPYLSQHVDHIIRVTMEGNSDVQDAVEAVIGERLGCELAEIERSEEGVQVAY